MIPAAEDARPDDAALAGRRRWAWIPWAAFVIFFLTAAAAPLPAGLARPGAFAIAALASAIIFWGSGVQDPSLTGLLLISLIALLGVMSFADAIAGFGTEFVWLLVVTFILARAMGDVGLGRRIALSLLRRAGSSPSAVLFALLAAVVVLSFMIPTAAGRISAILPVCLGIIEAARLSPGSPFAKAMLIGTSHTSILAGIGLMTAAGATVYAAGAFESLIGFRWAYLAWLAAFFPVVIIFMLILWRMLLRMFPPERTELAASADFVRTELARLGPLSTPERKMLAVFAGVLALWILGPRLGVSTPQAGMLGAIALMLPGIRVLSWERALDAVRWNVIILFGVSLALASALERSGAGRWLTDVTLRVLHQPSPVAAALVLAPLVMLVRVGFVNNLGMIAAGLPLAITLARGWGLNPVWIGMVVVLTAGPGFVLPTQTPTGMITMGYEHYRIRDYMRTGAVASIVLLILTWLAAFLYWPLLGYRP
ncbi:MAG TPA: DASS family sodium-coupled anion symporter [bacterium]|nr:DASS family sodium-coupled anion symporter [bacterium]